jgi:SAM-dependent methyltransferase
MEKADYSKIAPSYDKGRALSDKNIDLWLGLVSRYARLQDGARVLDLGCGTGRFAIPMARRFGYRVTGADSSGEMLARAQEKDTDGLVHWDRQDAQNLTYDDGVFDIVFMSHLLHHLISPIAVLKECRRVLTESGVVANRYGSIEQIRDDVEHRFFPEALAFDEKRTPCANQVERWMKEAGFSTVVTVDVVQQTFETAEARLTAARVKSISVLTLISPEAYHRGLQNLSAYIQENPGDPWLLRDRATFTVGYVAG